MDSHVESIYLRELGDECEFALLAVQEMNRALKEPISLPASMTYDEPTNQDTKSQPQCRELDVNLNLKAEPARINRPDPKCGRACSRDFPSTL